MPDATVRHVCRVAVAWPRPRGERWRGGANGPDQSDALLALEDRGFQVSIEDATRFPLNPLASLHEMWSGLDPVRTMRLLARRRRYDAVIGVGDAVAFILALTRSVLGLGPPFVLIDPALSHDYPRRQRLQDYVLPRARHVVVFGRVQLDCLRERYGDGVRASFVPHRIDTEFFRPGETAVSREDRRKVVVSVGGDASRDYPTLLEAVALCRERGRDDFDVVIVTHRELGALPRGVKVIGERVAWNRLRDLYREASVVVVPLVDSLHAGGINALLEAMAVGRPVVVSASRGIADYVEDGVSAATVPPGDREALAERLLRLVDDEGDAERLGDGGRDFVTRECGYGRYADRLAGLIREAIGHAERI